MSRFFLLGIHQFDALPINLMEVYRIFPLKSFFGYDSGRILKYVSNLLRNSLNLAAFPSNSSTSGVFLSLARGAGSGVDSGEIVSIRGRLVSLCKSTVFYRTPAPIIVYYFPYITCLLYLLFLIKHVRTSG